MLHFEGVLQTWKTFPFQHEKTFPFRENIPYTSNVNAESLSKFQSLPIQWILRAAPVRTIATHQRARRCRRTPARRINIVGAKRVSRSRLGSSMRLPSKRYSVLPRRPVNSIVPKRYSDETTDPPFCPHSQPDDCESRRQTRTLVIKARLRSSAPPSTVLTLDGEKNGPCTSPECSIRPSDT